MRLAFQENDATEPFFLPEKMSLKKFLDQSKFVFLGLHGGIGENGTLQRMMEKKKIKYNGPSSEVSKVCMDKYVTGQKLQGP